MLGYLGQAALLAIGGTMVVHHTLTLGGLAAFFLYLTRFFQPIQLLVQQYNTFQQGQASVTKLGALLSTGPSVPEDPDAAGLPPIDGTIDFQDVTFGYDPKTPVISGVNLRIAAGETVAFVGPTGAGKSTLAKLVTRFYDPGRGRVLIDGHDLRRVTLASLRRQLGVVPQEPFLFARTIRENLAFARPEAADDEIWAAVRAGRAWPRSSSACQTGSTRSCTSAARPCPPASGSCWHWPGHSWPSPGSWSWTRRPPTWTSSRRARIEAALDVLLEARTAVLIAHRLSTAMKADRIAVVDEGRLAEVGSHDELVALGGRYAEMYATWAAHSHGDTPEDGRHSAAPRPAPS